MKELIKNIEQWSTDRNLHTADPMKQYDKLVEEYGELVRGLNKQDEQLIKDSIGDMFVVLTIMLRQIDGAMSNVLSKRKYKNCGTPKGNSTLDYINSISKVGLLLNNYITFTMEAFKGIANDLLHRSICTLVVQMELTAKEYGTDLESCVQLAYDEIKDRKGKMIDGKFVKESDL